MDYNTYYDPHEDYRFSSTENGDTEEYVEYYHSDESLLGGCPHESRYYRAAALTGYGHRPYRLITEAINPPLIPAGDSALIEYGNGPLIPYDNAGLIQYGKAPLVQHGNVYSTTRDVDDYAYIGTVQEYFLSSQSRR